MAKTQTGTVVSTKMEKTIVVSVIRRVQHPLVGKTIRRSKRYKAHNDNLDLKVGDRVVIEETRPISKDKRFKAIKKID